MIIPIIPNICEKKNMFQIANQLMIFDVISLILAFWSCLAVETNQNELGKIYGCSHASIPVRSGLRNIRWLVHVVPRAHGFSVKQIRVLWH